jgi:hypothetical protein
MILTRQQLADAIVYYGRLAGQGDGITLPREASKLVDVLAMMDFHRETSVELPDDSERGRLALQAQQALRAEAAAGGALAASASGSA